MQDLTELQRRFDLPGVTIEAGQGGLPRVAVSTPAAEGHVYLHGAHVTHYQPRGKGGAGGQKPVLFMSAASHFAAGKPIRGGVPLIFPWFGPNAADPKAPAHGFARTVAWELREVTRVDDESVAVELFLGPSEATRKVWPHEFDLIFTVVFGPSLTMALEVRNTGSAPFKFEEALHTYLTVSDVRQVTIEGLAGREFIDKVDGAKRKTQAGAIKIEGETDRVYLNTHDTVLVNDRAFGGRAIEVSKQNSDATVVWNPWVAKAKAMADFGDDEWPAMACVETANAADCAVTLEPGATHVMHAAVRVV